MKLHKLREWFVEAKIYFVRTTGYLNILNFLMIVLIFFNTTLWEYSAIQQIFHSRKIFMMSGFIFVILLTIFIGYFDTRLKLWRTEIERNYFPERSPILIPEAFQSAKMLNELKEKGVNTDELEANLDEMFKKCGLNKEFDFFKRTTKGK
jgi:hypothetical protein